MGISRHLANIRGLAAITLVTATMTACSTGGGNPLDTLTGDYKYAPDYIKANIIARKSTKEQIRQAFGAPYSAQDNVSDNSSEWYYDRNESGLNSLTKMAASTPTDTVPETRHPPCFKGNRVWAMRRK